MHLFLYLVILVVSRKPYQVLSGGDATRERYCAELDDIREL
jgi:hypothetical protein